MFHVETGNVPALREKLAANFFLVDLLSEKFDRLDDKTYLEVGYGAGFALYAATSHFRHAMGIDLDDALIRTLCRELGFPPNLELQSDLGRLSRPADIAVLWHCLEHIPDCTRFIRALRDVLAPGGYILLQVPLLRRDAVIDVHFSFFGLTSLRNLFQCSDFDEIDYWFDHTRDFLAYMVRRSD